MYKLPYTRNIRIMLLLLIVAIVFSLFACGDSPGMSRPTKTPKPTKVSECHYKITVWGVGYLRVYQCRSYTWAENGKKLLLRQCGRSFNRDYDIVPNPNRQVYIDIVND